MAQITCPKCGEIIKLDKSAYDSLLNEIEKEEIEKRLNIQIQQIEAKYKAEFALEANKLKTNKDNEVAELKKTVALLEEKLKSTDKDTQLAVSRALDSLKDQLSDKEKEITKLKGDLDSSKKDLDISSQKLKEQYEFQLKAKDDEIKHWKEFRVGDSTKDIGEALEHYCENMFNKDRAVSYPFAYFDKDNQVVKGEEETKGTKGDYIFRDYTESDPENEIVSIMFDMKNQKEDGDTKISSHLKKLNSDRIKKNCEYAVLVTTLEPDNELYNSGILDVSYQYEKMYVVRPQFFMTIIGLIKNMAKTRFEYRKQVIQYERENADIANFEKAVKAVAEKINADYVKAGKIYGDVDKMCDDIIKKVEHFRNQFKVAAGHIGAAVNQLPNLEIRKLTKNNPTMKEKFESLEANDKGE